VVCPWIQNGVVLHFKRGLNRLIDGRTGEGTTRFRLAIQRGSSRSSRWHPNTHRSDRSDFWQSQMLKQTRDPVLGLIQSPDYSSLARVQVLKLCATTPLVRLLAAQANRRTFSSGMLASRGGQLHSERHPKSSRSRMMGAVVRRSGRADEVSVV
jgi:hypothetical protein